MAIFSRPSYYYGAAFRWCIKRIVSLSLIALLVLAYCALWRNPRLSASRVHTIGDDGTRPFATFDRHQPGSWHDHGHARNALSISRVVYILYSIFTFLVAAIFPIRACKSVYAITRLLKEANAAAQLKTRHFRESGESSVQEDSPISASSSLDDSSEETLYDADDDEPASPMILHAIILPNYKEDFDTLRTTLQVLASHPRARRSYDVSCAAVLFILPVLPW